MTNREMTEIFSAMLLAWPNAEVFKGGVERLAPTIKLWTNCTADIDFWTGQQAVYRLCRSCKFPPTIAEFREQADRVNAEMRAIAGQTVWELRGADSLYGSVEAFYEKLPKGAFTREVIDALGGPGALLVTVGHGGEKLTMWNVSGMEAACRAVVSERPELIGGNLPALICKKEMV